MTNHQSEMSVMSAELTLSQQSCVELLAESLSLEKLNSLEFESSVVCVLVIPSQKHIAK